MSAQTADPAAVRVLHRRRSGDDACSSSSSEQLEPQELIQRLQADNDSLRQRLEQTKAAATTERKRLADDLRLEKAGRQRAEELLVRQAKELEACAGAKARLEEAFSRAMSELRYSRLEHGQAQGTIQQLLRELMQLRDIISRLSSGATMLRVGSSSSLAAAGAGAAGGGELGASSPLSKSRSKGKLIGELQQLRAAVAAAEARLGVVEAEKERAQENEKMVADQTAKLLNDRAALLADISTKSSTVQGLQAGLDHLQHQLGVALADRSLLLQQLRVLAAGEGAAAGPELEALISELELQDAGGGGGGFDDEAAAAAEDAAGAAAPHSEAALAALFREEEELLAGSLSRQASASSPATH